MALLLALPMSRSRRQSRSLNVAELSRRSVIKGACALLALGTLNMPTAANAAVRRLPDGRLSIQVNSIPELSEVGGAVKVGKFKGKAIGISRITKSRYVAFSLICPHQEYPVVRSAAGWVCPAHQSEFEPDGDLVLGPATSGLARIPSRVVKGRLIIG